MVCKHIKSLCARASRRRAGDAQNRLMEPYRRQVDAVRARNLENVSSEINNLNHFKPLSVINAVIVVRGQ